MTIDTITRYRFGGKEYHSLKDIRQLVENGIGAIIDASPVRLKPRDRLAVFEAIQLNHKRLQKLLSVEYVCKEGDLLPEVINILDMDV